MDGPGDYGYGTAAPVPPAPPPPGRFAWLTSAFAEAPVTVSIVVLTIGVWVVHTALQSWAGINTDLTLADPGTAIHGDWWRLFTPMVVHFGIAHIGFNMLALWTIGRPVEKVIGRWQFLVSYLACGVAGQVVSDVHYGQTVLSGGASGAIFGIVGVLVANHVALTWVERHGRVSTQRWRFTSSAAKSLAIQGGLWLILGSVVVHLDSAAHIGGVVLGLAIGAVIGVARSRPAPV